MYERSLLICKALILEFRLPAFLISIIDNLKSNIGYLKDAKPQILTGISKIVARLSDMVLKKIKLSIDREVE